MAKIQKLYEVCKVSLSANGSLSPEAVDSVCSVLGKKCPLSGCCLWLDLQPN